MPAERTQPTLAREVDVYFSADIEADGPIPGMYSMLSLGMVVVEEHDGITRRRFGADAPAFYRELAPTSERADPDALAISQLDRDRLFREGLDPSTAMEETYDWVVSVSRGGSPVLVCYPRSFDWLWLYWYFVAFCNRGSPFGFADCIDVKTLIAAATGARFTRSDRSALPAELLPSSPHTHHALQDARAQGEMFCALVDHVDRLGESR